MKAKAFLTFNLVCFISIIGYAQWSGSSITTGTITRNGSVSLAGTAASSLYTLIPSPRLMLLSSGYAPDGVTRWQNWSLQSVQESVWGAGDLVFFSNRDGAGFVEKLRVTSVGDVGIGTTAPDAKLAVKGDIHAEEVRVDLNVPAPDYVFAEDYNLPSLESISAYIKANQHLPEVPSAEEMEENGIDLGVMNMLLLKKVEELTLYLIELEKENTELRRDVSLIRNLQKRLENLENLNANTND